MKLTKKHIEVADALSLAKESMESIAKTHGICRATIYNWIADEDFSSFMDQLEKKHKRMALFIAGRWTAEAVKRLIENITSKDGDSEIARKSAMDLLKIAGLNVDKIKGEGMGGDIHQYNYFGDDTINKFADQTLQARAKESTDSGDRFKAD